jgi:hypothetical protein
VLSELFLTASACLSVARGDPPWNKVSRGDRDECIETLLDLIERQGEFLRIVDDRQPAAISMDTTGFARYDSVKTINHELLILRERFSPVRAVYHRCTCSDQAAVADTVFATMSALRHGKAPYPVLNAQQTVTFFQSCLSKSSWYFRAREERKNRTVLRETRREMAGQTSQ